MAIVRWDPLQMMRWPSMWDDEDVMPAITDNNLDIFETENEVTVKANVAGVTNDKVDITFEKGILWIRAEEEKEENKGKKYYRKAMRTYSYKIAVPGNIDTKSEPEATVTNGIVSVTFKKAEEAKPKKITVKTGK